MIVLMLLLWKFYDQLEFNKYIDIKVINWKVSCLHSSNKIENVSVNLHIGYFLNCVIVMIWKCLSSKNIKKRKYDVWEVLNNRMTKSKQNEKK